ncbi:GNAT family N-acetyltransferase [Candidatus Acetothermia bacterium]|nr:GNAT family N-acetyltransferase [Candidatus Acetothermia bacterium]
MVEEQHLKESVTYRINPPLANEDLNELFSVSWLGHTQHDFHPILSRSLAYVCACHKNRLIGFVNLAWDGGVHAFILDTTVHPDFRRRGIGQQLVKRAVEIARERKIEWVHVDFEPRLREFYQRCGFRYTEGGLIHLREGQSP